MSFKEKYREEMANQRLSGEKRLEIEAELAGAGRETRRHPLRKPARIALIAAALAVALAVTAVAADSYLGGWFDDGTGLLTRGLFGHARLVKEDTIELPHVLFAEQIVDTEEELKVYLFLARGEETLIDRIIDVKDAVDVSPDHSYTYAYEDEDVRAEFTITRVENGVDIQRHYAIRDLCTGQWEEDNSTNTRCGSNGHSDVSTTSYIVYVGDDDPVHTPCYVPIGWTRGETVTGYGIDNFSEEKPAA